MFYLIRYGNNHYKYISKNVAFKGISTHTCNKCNRTISSFVYDSINSYRFLLSGGQKYPDALEFCGVGDMPFTISQKAFSIYEHEGITGINKSYDVSLINKQGIIIKPNDVVPRYVCIDINGSIDLNYASMCLKIKNKCNECGQFDLNKKGIKPFILDINTWNNMDLCRLKTKPGFIICSEKMMEITRKYNLKGITFEAIKTD